LLNTEVFSVPHLGVVVAVVDLASAAIDDDFATAVEVGGSVVTFSAKRHAGAVGLDWLLGEFLSLKEHWEGEPAAVRGVDLFDLYGLVAQEEVEGVEFLTSVVARVVPADSKGKHIAVIGSKALEVLVGAATLEKHLDVVLVLSQIGRVLLEVDHGTSSGEFVIWEALGTTQVSSLIGVELASEIVTVDNTEHSAVNIQIHAEAEIGPDVDGIIHAWHGELVALEEDTLWDAGVLNAVLNDVDGVVLKIVVKDALANTVVLVGILYDWLLEVNFEIENLKLNSWRLSIDQIRLSTFILRKALACNINLI